MRALHKRINVRDIIVRSTILYNLLSNNVTRYVYNCIRSTLVLLSENVSDTLRLAKVFVHGFKRGCLF